MRHMPHPGERKCATRRTRLRRKTECPHAPGALFMHSHKIQACLIFLAFPGLICKASLGIARGQGGYFPASAFPKHIADIRRLQIPRGFSRDINGTSSRNPLGIEGHILSKDGAGDLRICRREFVSKGAVVVYRGHRHVS